MTKNAPRLAALLLVMLSVSALEDALPTGGLGDYGGFMASGRAASQGQNPYGICELTFHVVAPGFDLWNPNLNPPVSVPVFQLLDRLEPQRGYRLWWSFSFACYFYALVLLARRYGTGPSWLVACWALALAGFWDTLKAGQIYNPLVLASVGAWLLLDRGRMACAGVLMGVLVSVKPNFAVWPALLLLAGHYRVPLAAAVTVGVLALVPLFMYDPEIYWQWIALIQRDDNRAAFITNASLLGLAERMGLGQVGATLSLALLAALAGWAYRRKPPPLRASALGILGAILASPIAWVHYTMFLLPVFFSRRMSSARVAAAVLLVIPVPIVLGFLDSSAWMQVTLGSAYNWAMLLCLADEARDSWQRPALTPA